MDAGIVPVKRLTEAKTRLAPHLDDRARAAVARALLGDVLHLCATVTSLRWFFVSDDATVLAAARGRGFDTVEDRGTGLNDALSLAIAAASSQGADTVTLIPADAPLTTPSDLADLLDTAASSDVVLVPAERDGGTNGLYASPPGILEPRFGDHSLGAHAAAADAAGYRTTLLPLARLALDIDTIADVDRFLAEPGSRGTRSGTLLRRLRPLVGG